MKNLFTTILSVCMMMLTIVPAHAATTPYVCPNGNAACVANGACVTGGSCGSHTTCVTNGVCQYPEGCSNGGVPKRDGTGNANGVRGGGHGKGHGAGHCGGRNR